MQSRAIILILCGAALSACTGIPSMPSFSVPSFNMPSFSVPGFNSPGTPVRVESIPPGAEASIANGPSCKTPCTLKAPGGSGSFTVSFALRGYESQTVPVRVAITQSNSSWDSADAGINAGGAATVIEPDPVVAELSPMAAAPKAKMPPPPKAKKPPPKQPTAAAAPAPSPASPPPPAAPAMPTPQTGFGPAPAQQPNVFR
jgi:hypothetical protein